MSESPTIQLQVSANASQAIAALGNLSSVLERVKTAVNKGLNLNNFSASINKLGESIRANITEETVSRFERFADAASKLSSVGGIRLSGLRRASSNVQNNDTMRDLQGRLNDTAGSATVLDSAMRDVQERISDTGPAADGAGEKAKSFADRLRELTVTSGRTSSGIVNLFKDFARIAKYRLLRTAIKEITEGFRFGVDNVRAYSKAIGSDFAKDMNSAGAALDTMKNAIGASVAPVLQMLIPILKTVTNAVIEAVNWLNQLFTLLRGGGTWTRAKALSDPLDEMKKSAKGAGKEVKNLLADWDELNIIQSKGGSGSGASAVELDYADMFEEVEVFDERIKKIANWIKDNFEDIKRIALETGAAILAWNISKSFGGILGGLIALAAVGLTVKILWDMSYMLNGNYLESGDTGWLLTDILTTAIGAGLAAKAVSQLTGEEGKKYATVAAGVVIGIAAIAGIKAILDDDNVTPLQSETLIAALKNSFQFGIGMGFIENKRSGGDWKRTVATGLSGTALTIGVTIGMKAVKGWYAKGDLDLEGALALIGSAIVATPGIVGLIKNYTNVSWKRAGEAGTSLAAVVIGATVAVKAIKDVVETGEITTESVIEGVIGFLTIGAGIIPGLVSTGKFDWKRAGATGTGTAALLLGVTVGLKAIKDVVDTGDITKESVIEGVMSAFSLGVSAMSLTKAFGSVKRFKHQNWKQKNLLQVGTGASLITLGVTVGVKAIKDIVDTGEITKETVISGVTSFLSFGGGITELVHGFTKTSWTQAAGTGFGTSALIFGVSVGIAAIKDVVDAGEITQSSVEKAVIASLLSGLGVAAITLSAGASAAVALAAAGGAILATAIVFGAAVAVVTMINASKDDIQWGEKELTNADIETFVNEKMFSVPVKTTVSLIADSITATKEETTKVETKATELLAPMNNIRLNVNTENAKNDLMDAIFGKADAKGNRSGGLIGEVQALARQRKTNIETGFALVPVKNDQGEDITAGILQSGSEAWEGITSAMDALGADLSKHLTESMKANLEPGMKEYEEKMVLLIAETMRNVAFATAGANTESGALTTLTLGLDELTEKSFNGVLELYKNYKEQLKTGYTQAYTESANSLLTAQRTYQALADGYLKMAEEYKKNGDTEAAAEAMKKYEQYTASAKKMAAEFTQTMENMAQSIDDAVEAASALGKEQILESIKKVYADKIKNPDFETNFVDQFFGAYFAFDEFDKNDKTEAVAMIRNYIAQLTSIPFEYLELTDTTGFELFEKELQSQIVKELSDLYGADAVKKMFETAGVSLPEEILNYLAEQAQAAAEAAKVPPANVEVPVDTTFVPGMEEAEETLEYEALDDTSVKIPVNAKPELNTNNNEFADIYDEIYAALAEYDQNRPNLNVFWENILEGLVKSYIASKGYTGEVAEQLADSFLESWIGSIETGDAIDSPLKLLKEMLESPEDWNITPPNTEPLMTGLRTDAQEMDRIGDEMLTAANKILGAYSLVSSIGMYSFGGGTMRKRFGEDLFKPYNYAFAEGGFPTTGSMFIARESGPELVGRIGNRTAVANNDQIVSGVANGVAAGQAEQNALLRQQNDYLRRILAKESTVKVEPTAEWGRFNQRSEELRARSAGA